MSSYTYREKSFECAFCGVGTILTNDQNQTEFHADLPYKWLKSLDGYACTKSQSLIDLDHFEEVLGFYYDVEDEDDSSEFKTLEFIHQFKMFNPYGDQHETN